MRITFTSFATALAISALAISAGVPNIVHFQGRLTDAAGAVVPDGPIQATFSIYAVASGGAPLWNSGIQLITIAGGTFSYDLGSNVVLPDLFGPDSNRYLGITVVGDPEMSPRTRFTSTPYVFRSKKSDLASDADSLGGLHPSFYLDWGNITNVPSGFADGTDDVGIDLGTGDERYLEVLGDTLQDDLVFDPNRDGIINGKIEMTFNAANLELSYSGNLKSKLYGAIWGELDLFDASGDLTAVIDATNSSGGRMVLGNKAGASTIYLDGGSSGDVSVQLPIDAINSLEILNEPGIASTLFPGPDFSPGTDGNNDPMQDVVTVTIDIPSSGYMLVTSNLYAFNFYDSITFKGSYIVAQIDETAGGPRQFEHSIFQTAQSGYQHFPSLQRVYNKPQGSYTFRLEAAGKGIIKWAIITAVYFPTSYGPVVTTSSTSGDHPDAEAIRVSSPDGSVTTAYKMDLRYYEEKARLAKIAKQKAELAEVEAKLQLARARRQQKPDNE